VAEGQGRHPAHLHVHLLASGGRRVSGPIEPSADLRQAASALRQMFIALINEGFDERQALTIIGHAIAANGGSQ
jgi:hypothetical protein